MKFPRPIRTLRNNVSPETIASQFLFHEFLKIFRDIRDPLFRQRIKRSIYRFKKRDGERHYWQLVAAIAEGLRVKWVYRLLTDTSYKWNLEVSAIKNLTMTGFSPLAVDKIIHRCGRDFYRFADYYRAHLHFFKKYMPNLQPRPERDMHPVFVFWDSGQRRLRLFDGMRRTTLAAIHGKKTIKAFVGYPVRKGKSMVNDDKIHFFKLLYRNSSKDAATFRAFTRVGKEIVKQSRNSVEVFTTTLKPWSDIHEKKLTKAIIDKRGR